MWTPYWGAFGDKMKKIGMSIIIFLQFLSAQDLSFIPLTTKVTKDCKEYICSVLQSYETYKEYEIQTSKNEIILKSKELNRNKYNQESYSRIYIREDYYEEGKYNENNEIWYQKKKVKIKDEVFVPAPPTIRVFYENKYITVSIQDEIIFDFDLLCRQLINKLYSYEIISINTTASKLIWIDKEKSIISANNTHLCMIHKCKMEKEKLPILYGLVKFLDVEYIENVRLNNFPNCNDIILGGCVAQKQRYKEKYICKECIRARDEWILKNRNADYIFYDYKE